MGISVVCINVTTVLLLSLGEKSWPIVFKEVTHCLMLLQSFCRSFSFQYSISTLLRRFSFCTHSGTLFRISLANFVVTLNTSASSAVHEYSQVGLELYTVALIGS